MADHPHHTVARGQIRRIMHRYRALRLPSRPADLDADPAAQARIDVALIPTRGVDDGLRELGDLYAAARRSR